MYEKYEIYLTYQLLTKCNKKGTKMTSADVDIFAGVTDEANIATGDGVSPVDPAGSDADSAASGSNEENSPSEENSSSDSNSEENETPIETVATIPVGAMSVTEFAAHMSGVLMKEKFAKGEDFDPSDYVVPQAVYQTVKAQRDRIPHVLVQGEGDAEARVYILKDEATAWWTSRRDRLSTRGSGAQRASSRSVEDNLGLLAAAVEKHLYAVTRQAMWNARVEQNSNLVEKYKGFLKDASADQDTVDSTIQEATDRFNAEQATKAAEKAAKAAKSGTPATDDTDAE